MSVRGVFNQLFGDVLVSRRGQVPTEEALGGKRVVGIYFTASVCEKCRAFTPALATVYNNMRLKRYQDLCMQHEFEIVMVSMDANPLVYRDFLLQTPFLALPLRQKTHVHELLQRFEVKRIPSVVFVNEDAVVIERDGRAIIDMNYADLRIVWDKLIKRRAWVNAVSSAGSRATPTEALTEPQASESAHAWEQGRASCMPA